MFGLLPSIAAAWSAAMLDAISYLFKEREVLYYVPHLLGITLLYALRLWSAGYKCQEERNLHNKTFILVGCFSGPGLALLTSLATRGAQIIALHPDPSSPPILQLILLLRSSTGNERIYGDVCDMQSMGSIRSFVMRWEKDGRSGMVQDLEARVEGVVFCDGEGSGMDSFGMGIGKKVVEEGGESTHTTGLLARHCLVQLLLPALVRSAANSTVRIISMVSPFYSARSLVLDDLNYTRRKWPKNSPWVVQGQIALGSIALFRELQDRMDEARREGSAGVLVMSVCGGFTRSWFRQTLRADMGQSSFSFFGLLVYLFWFPLIWVFGKSAEEASQGLLGAVLGKVGRGEVPIALGEETEEELKERELQEKKIKLEMEDKLPKLNLRGGMLYREGKEVRVIHLEQAGQKLGAELWKIESKTVEGLVAKAAEEETRIQKEKDDLAREEKLSKGRK